MDLLRQDILEALTNKSALWFSLLVIIGLCLALFVVAKIVKKSRRIKSCRSQETIRDIPETKQTLSATSISHTKIAPSDAKISIAVAEEELFKTVEEYPEELRDILKIDKAAWLKKLWQGLSKTRFQLNALKNLFVNASKLDDELLEQLHETLYRSDFGTSATDRLVSLIKSKFSGLQDKVSWPAIQQELSSVVLDIFERYNAPVNFSSSSPTVILIVGVNGVGKTTTIGKLAAHFLAQGKSVLLCAADTYRAAAIEQLQVWADRLQVDMIRHQAGADPAAVAYDAAKAAVSRNIDVLLIDTAGRLHNKTELMQELQKVNRVIGKDLPGAPHEIWLVVDATAGQNTLVQIKAFKDLIPVSGLIVTKLDGTAKGGVLIAATEQYNLPIRYIGVGEKASDLQAFTPKDYVESLFDL